MDARDEKLSAHRTTRAMQGGISFLPYLLIPALSAASPLLVIPAVTSRLGAEGWSVLAIAQSVGLAGAVVAELGWGVTGPQAVASSRSSAARQQRLYQSALLTRLVALAAVGPTTGLLAWAIAPTHGWTACALAMATSTGALTPSWFFIGSGRPYALLAVESVPRLVMQGVTAFAILHGAPLSVSALFTVIATVIALAATPKVFGYPLIPRLSARDLRAELRQQLPVSVGRIINATYTTLPIALVGLANPAVVASFSAAERLMRMALTILAGVPSRLQSWLGRADDRNIQLRSRQAILINVALGAAAASLFVLMTPLAADIIFTGEVPVSRELAFVAAVTLFLTCMSRGLGLVLVAAGMAGRITFAISAAALTGVPLVLLLSHKWGAVGGLLGEAMAEAVGVLVQVALLAHLYSSRRRNNV